MAGFVPNLILEPSRLKPYPYQEQGVRAIVREFRNGIDATAAIMPTGTGKSYLVAWVSRYFIHKGERALVIAHRKELIEQLANSHADLGIPVAIEQGDRRARASDLGMPRLFSDCPMNFDPVCVIASKDSMQGKRLASWPDDYFGFMAVDESHHALADSYQPIFNRFNRCKRLFVTATPKRLDGGDVGSLVQSIAFQYLMRDAIAEGWLCRPVFVRCRTEIDLRAINTRGMADMSDSDVAEAIRPHIEELANAVRQEIGERPTIVFCPDVRSSDAMASALTSLGFDARSVCGVSKDRDAILAAYRAGEFQVLVNAMLLTEGVDFPRCSAVVFCRPTQSEALYRQMAGRGLRRGKKDCHLIDFSWITEQHQLLAGPATLFDDFRNPTEVMEIAGGLLDSGQEKDVLEAVERAEAIQRERSAIRISAREMKVRYERIVYDPFAAMETLGVPIREEPEGPAQRMATEKQVELLKRKGIEGADKMSFRRARMIIDNIVRRRDEGKATLKMIASAIANGMAPEEAREAKFEEVSEFLDRARGKFSRN
jgi:superfamily II DNA or RNA helicase